MPLLGLGILDDSLLASLLVPLEAVAAELAADDRRM